MVTILCNTCGKENIGVYCKNCGKNLLSQYDAQSLAEEKFLCPVCGAVMYTHRCGWCFYLKPSAVIIAKSRC